MASNPVKARRDLHAWRERQPANFYTSDRQLVRLLQTFLGQDRYLRHREHFASFGAVCAGPLDEAAVINNRGANLPELDRWSPLGERIEAVAHHPSYHDCGRHIYEDGEVIAAYAEPASNVRALALFYLSSHVGEAGHNCPVACTAGVVKALGAEGSDALKARWLGGVLTNTYADRLDGAQFVTEVQGGSDVGLNAVEATPDGEGFGTTRWRITGEKWFCSNSDADLILMTARVAGHGTQGLGLFLVPRLLEDGTVNHFTVRRLKDKIGTRSMPSGEIDFQGAVGYAVGPVDKGFRTLMAQVINTSRLYNTVGTAGIARRARLVAQAYAQSRVAFGHPIAQYPLVQEMVARMRASSQALTAGAMRLAHGLDRAERGELAGDELAWLRVGTNLAKMRSCQHSHRVVLTAIETLGGNGAIETFSVLPRLLRDNVVYENWEGTHNTLIAQTHRDFAKHGLHAPFIAVLRRDLTTGDAAIDAALAPAHEALDRAEDALGAILALPDPGTAALLLRPHVERLGDALFAGAFAQDLLTEADPARRAAELDVLTVFVDEHLRAARPDPDLATAARFGRIVALDG